jgi:Na+/H+ antiporter
VATVEAVIGLVLLAVVVAALAHRLSTPAPSLLVVVGLGVGFIPGVGPLHVSPEVIVLGVLPPLLFSAAQELSLPDLRAVWRPVAVLAVALVLVTAGCVALVARWLDGGLGLAVAFVLGAILASTDPVAVTALSRRLRLPARLGTLVQAESLFNDATSLLLFQVAVAIATTRHVTATDVTVRVVALGGGGVAAGVVVGLLGGALMRRLRRPVVVTALALVTPYVAAGAAYAVDVSAVTAVIVAGLLLGRRGRDPDSALPERAYRVVVFLVENVVFAVIGVALAGYLRELKGGDRGMAVALVAAVTGTLLLTRGLALAAGVVATRARGRQPGPARAQWARAAVVTWAGARGVVPLAAVLAVPTRTPHGALLSAVATAVVVVTLVVQGTTLAPLVRRAGFGQPDVEPCDTRYQ